MKKSTAILRFIIVEVILFTVIVFLINIFISLFSHYMLAICIKGDEDYHERAGWTEEATESYNIKVATQEKYTENHPFVGLIQSDNNIGIEFAVLMAIAILLGALMGFFYKYNLRFIRIYKRKYSRK